MPPRYLLILATTPAPTVRPPSRMAKRSPSSIAIGAINSISIEMLSPGITISVPSGSHRARHIGRAEVELRPVVGKKRGVPPALLLGQDIGLALTVGVRRDRPRRRQHLAALHLLALGAAQQGPDIVARLALLQ